MFFTAGVAGIDPYAKEPGAKVCKHAKVPVEIHFGSGRLGAVIKSPSAWGYGVVYFKLNELNEKLEDGQTPELQKQLSQLREFIRGCFRKPEAWSGATELAQDGINEIKVLFPEVWTEIQNEIGVD